MVVEVMIAILAVSPVAGARQNRYVIFDDFERTSTAWTFHQSGSRGSQVATEELSHSGQRCLVSETDRHGLQNVRGDFRYQDEGSRLSFWFRLEYDPVLSPDTSLTIGLHSASDNKVYSTLTPPPPAGQWRLLEVEVSDISPLLAGDWIDQLLIGVTGRATPLKLYLDDVCIQNKVVRRANTHHVTAAHRSKPPQDGTVKAICLPHGAMPEEIEKYANAGINTVFLIYPEEAAAVAWSAVGQRHGFAIWIVLPLFYDVGHYIRSGDLRPCVFADRVPDDLVCPLQDEYWERFVTPIVRRWAQLARVAPIEGIVLEANAVGTIHSSYTEADSCLCDDCFSRFLSLGRIGERLESFPMSDRWSWVVANQRVAQWRETFALRTRIKAEILRQQMERENERISFGAFDLKGTWLHWGLLTGLGNGSSPPIAVAREPTFGRGFSAAVRWFSEDLARRGIAHHWLPGFDVTKFKPAELAVHLRAAIAAGYGYWLDLSALPPVKENSSSMPSLSPELLEAVREVNRSATPPMQNVETQKKRGKQPHEKRTNRFS